MIVWRMKKNEFLLGSMISENLFCLSAKKLKINPIRKVHKKAGNIKMKSF